MNSFFFFQAEDGIRDGTVTGVQTCALPISILEGGSSGPLRGRVVRLGPDNDAALRIALTVAANATVGTIYSAGITATAVGDPSVKASMTIQVKVSSRFPWELVVAVGAFAAAIAILAAVVVLRRRRRPRT